MVRLFVRFALWMVVGMIVLPANAASVDLSPSEITLGEPVVLILKGDHVEQDFAKFDKDKMRRDFEVYDVDGDSDYMRLVLYPRKAGEAHFPAIHIGGLQFAGVVVKVDPNPDVSIEWQAPKNDTVVNQLLSWKALVKTSDPSLGVKMLLHPHASDKVMHLFSDKPMPSHSSWLGNQREFQMLVGSDEPGKLKVRTPVIQVQNTGNGRPWLFFDATHWIHVKPLPGYLPVAMPIGQVSLQVEKLDFWQIQNSQLDWQLVLKGENIAPNSLPEISDQFRYNRSIEWLMPDQHKQQIWTDTGLVSERMIKQPLRFVALGLIHLPDMRITYFDPETGKLKDQFVPGQWVFSVPKVVYWLMNVLFYVLIALVLVVFVWVSVDIWYKWRLLAGLKQTESKEAIWQAIQKWMVAQFGESAQNLSFGQWQDWVGRYYGQAGLAELVAALDKDHFSLAAENAQDLAIAWAKTLPVFKWQRVLDRASLLIKRSAKA